MYYGFNKETKRCVWSINGPVEIPRDIAVVQSDIVYDIDEIQLCVDDGKYSIEPIVKTEEELLAEAKSKRDGLMMQAKEKIDVLTDVVDYAPTDDLKAELKEWRDYRAQLYLMNFDSMESLEWPAAPKS